MKSQDYEIVVVGVSAGGLNALSKIVPSLPGDFALAVIIVQHRRSVSDEYLSQHLDRICAVPVKEAVDKEPIRAGVVYLAPAGYHLLIESNETLALSVDSRVNHCRPAIDVLFDSAADVYREKTIGVVLTGSNEDGSRGLRRIKQCGGLAIVQDPSTAEADRMPSKAIEATNVDHIVRLEEIGPLLAQLAAVASAEGSLSLEGSIRE